MDYKIIKKEDNILDSKIEKLGVVVTFTMTEVIEHTAMLQKLLKELTAKHDYEKAKMTNIEANHPFILDMVEADMFTAHMYQEAKAIVVVSDKKIAEVEAQLQDYADETAEIEKQIPELVPVVTPDIEPVLPEATV